jgi:molybdopterin molybdotransferase
MITHEEALSLIRQHVGPLGVAEVATARCGGRVLAEDVTARLASPPFDKSAMDGFAVRSEDVQELPAELRLTGESFAGSWPDFEVGPGECARITTGAPVPQGADMVVMVEHTLETDGVVRIEKLSGENICAEGEDVTEGQTVLRAGQKLTPLPVGAAAAAGYGKLRVYRRPTSAVICTGTEVVEPPRPVGKGQIYNSNGYILSSLMAPVSSDYEYMGVVGDDEARLSEVIGKGLERDLLVLTGGVSMGQYDLVPDVLKALGVEVVFHKCAIKPGKPVLFGTRGKTCVFGMPGNPFSCFAVFHMLMRAALARMDGLDDLPPHYKTGVMSHGFRNRPGRKTFKPCMAETVDGAVRLRLVDSHGSADIVTAGQANALVTVPDDAAEVEAGQVMKYFDV